MHKKHETFIFKSKAFLDRHSYFICPALVRTTCYLKPHLYNPITVCWGNCCRNFHQFCSWQVDPKVSVEVRVKAVHKDIYLFLNDFPWSFLDCVPQSFCILWMNGVWNIQRLGQTGDRENEFYGRCSFVHFASSPHSCHPTENERANG